MNTRSNEYSLKTASMPVKDLDLAKREVAIYLSAFDVIDADNDMIKPGAFKKSIQERGPESGSNRQIAFLRHHDWQWQIGKFNRIEEDQKGLFAVGQLGTSTPGEDALRDYDDGIITEHSIGFQYVSDKVKFIEDETLASGGYFMIQEVKLWEGSAVTFGANEFTNVVEMSKTATGKQDALKKIADQISVVGKALKNGKGSDERLYELEMKLKYLNARLLDVVNTDPLDIKQSAVMNPGSSFDWDKVNNLLKSKL